MAAQAGVVYESERTPSLTAPVSRRPLKASAKNNMRYGRIEGIDKAVSRCAVGADFAAAAPREAMAIFDDAFERGVNTFDTSVIYGGGKSDEVLGHWMNSRGVRDRCVFLGKGGHTPDCVPDRIPGQLLRTMESAKIDSVDIYLLHRDNPDVPVGEFVDLLNEQKKAGRVARSAGRTGRSSGCRPPTTTRPPRG